MSSVDLDKIQSVIESEITRATTAERKRIVDLVGAFAKDLVEAIKNTEDVVSEPTKKSAPTKKVPGAPDIDTGAPAKSKSVFDAPPFEEGEEGEEGTIDGNTFLDLIPEVGDDEVADSDYAGKKIRELKEICKARGIATPKGLKQMEIAKLLILVDEEEQVPQ